MSECRVTCADKASDSQGKGGGGFESTQAQSCHCKRCGDRNKCDMQSNMQSRIPTLPRGPYTGGCLLHAHTGAACDELGDRERLGERIGNHGVGVDVAIDHLAARDAFAREVVYDVDML